MATKFNYSTILFDFDGTLTPSLPLWVRAFQYTFAQFGTQLSEAEVIKSCFYRLWEHLVEEFKLPCAIEFTQHMKKGLEDAFEDAELFPGVSEIIAECSRQDINLAIVTSSRRNIVGKFLKKYELERCFKTIVTEEDIIHHKPHPEPVLIALARLNCDPQQSILIGDSPADMLAAEAAGIEKGLFLPDEHADFYNFEELKGHQPQFIFHNYSQLNTKLSTQPTTSFLSI